MSFAACDSSPCYNNGMCVNLENGTFTCNCMSGYAGIQCQTGKHLTLYNLTINST